METELTHLLVGAGRTTHRTAGLLSELRGLLPTLQAVSGEQPEPDPVVFALVGPRAG